MAKGSGQPENAVQELVQKFLFMRQMMEGLGQNMGMMGKMKLMQSMMSGKLANLGMPGGPMLKTKKSGWQAPKDRNKKKKR